MLKTLKKFTQKKDNICAKTGCNNQVKRGNGTEFNYCSSGCQKSHYALGSSELYDDILEVPPYSSVSSSQWGVWTPNQGDAPPSYSSINNNATFVDDDLFGSLDNAQVTPLWETEDEPSSNTSNSLYSSSSKPTDDFPVWIGSSVDPLWTPPSNKNSSRNLSPLFTPPRSSSPSDEGEINCPTCTFFIRPNKTVCEMCGTSITRQEPKRSSYKKSSSKPKTTISTYRDLYEEDEEEEEEEEEEDEDDDDDENEDPFADPSPRQNNRSSHSSSDQYRNSRNQYSYSSSNNYENSSRNQTSSRNQSSSRNRGYNSYQTPTPPSDELWIDEDIFFEPIEPTPTRRPSRQKPPPKPYSTPSFFREAERRPKRNVQKPPTPPLKEKTVTCSACNFDNNPSLTHCEICYTQLGKTLPEQNKRTSVFNRMEETRAKKSCTVCSYYNDIDRAQCEMCYSPIGEAVRKSTFSLPSFFSHDVNKTQCPTCTFMNHPSMGQCEMCRSALPGNNLKQQQQQYQQIVDNTPGPVTKMFKLPVDDHDYMTVQQSFKAGIPNANILAILRVIMPARLVQAHEAYKKQIAAASAINVTHRMFHGTHVSCDAKRYYGASGWAYCTAADCGLCGIAQNGNSCTKSKYGGRMWFAQSSQTSLGYCRTDPIKAIFIQDIISAVGGPIIIVDREAATLVKFLVIYQV